MNRQFWQRAIDRNRIKDRLNQSKSTSQGEVSSFLVSKLGSKNLNHMVSAIAVKNHATKTKTKIYEGDKSHLATKICSNMSSCVNILSHPKYKTLIQIIFNSNIIVKMVRRLYNLLDKSVDMCRKKIVSSTYWRVEIVLVRPGIETP